MENRARPTAAAAANRRLKRNTHQNPVGNDALNIGFCLLQAALTIDSQGLLKRYLLLVFVYSFVFVLRYLLPLVYSFRFFFYLKHNLSARVNKNN